MNPLRDWKTTLAALPFACVTILLWRHAIDVQGALMILGGAATYLAAVAGDSKKENNDK
jgi:hypothetical protein